jgi:hypothetical protein
VLTREEIAGEIRVDIQDQAADRARLGHHAFALCPGRGTFSRERGAHSAVRGWLAVEAHQSATEFQCDCGLCADINARAQKADPPLAVHTYGDLKFFKTKTAARALDGW